MPLARTAAVRTAARLGCLESQRSLAHLSASIAKLIEMRSSIALAHAAAQKLGEVMALTRNPSCVHEKVGRYDNYHSDNVPGHN